jgi:putative IMPACT (imprinted ancient) family translation regulator
MKKLNESYLEIKKSKFYGYLYEISFLEDVTNILDEFKIKHKKARHIVYSYKYNSNEKNIQ